LPGLSILAASDSYEAVSLGSGCDLVFGEPSLVCQVINDLPNLHWVQSTWAGVEPFFSPGLRHDFLLTNARNVYGRMMSEYVFGYILLVERRIIPRWQSQLTRTWDESPCATLFGKRIGLMGVGTIGSTLASTAHHFGMQVYGYTRESETCSDVDKYFHGNRLVKFATELDYVVCSLPGTPSTMGIINDGFLASLPSTTWLINIGRGSTVEESALAEALNRGAIAGAVLDVFIEEPLPANHPLWKTPNTFITCHTAAKNYPPDIASLFIENYKLLIDGKPLLYQVDIEQQY
jgi:phosphoglycerate dehydrogenase-like enzyme